MGSRSGQSTGASSSPPTSTTTRPRHCGRRFPPPRAPRSRRVGGRLEGVPPSGHRRRDLDRASVGGPGEQAGGRDRPGPRVRHRRASDDASLRRAARTRRLRHRSSTSAAAPASSRSPRRDSASARSSRSTRIRSRSRSRSPTRAPTTSWSTARARRRHGRPAPDRPTSPSRTCCCGRWRRSSPGSRRGHGRHVGLPRAASSPLTRGGRTPSASRPTAGPPTASTASDRRTIEPMATFSTRFLGCKVSFADQQAIRDRLLADGHREVEQGGEIQVVNTCCVTHEAVSKSRQAASRAARSARTVYLTGCASRLDGALDRVAPNVVVTGRTGESAAAFVAGDVGAIGCVNAEHRLDRVRAFVKIQDGCSFSCSFCVIPLVRGATRSRSASAVLDEIRRRVSQGHREIVLTGVNLGCFRDREAGFTLARLVREAGAIPGLDRLRLSSIEVNHVSDELVAALRETPTLARHLHVPLQSGDDGVLRAMRRRYTVGAVPLPARAARRRVQPHGGRDRRVPDRGRGRVPADARDRRAGGAHQGPRLPVLAAAREPSPTAPTRSPSRSSGIGAPACARSQTSSPGAAGRRRSARPTASWSIARGGGTRTTTRRGSSRRRSARS